MPRTRCPAAGVEVDEGFGPRDGLEEDVVARAVTRTHEVARLEARDFAHDGVGAGGRDLVVGVVVVVPDDADAVVEDELERGGGGGVELEPAVGGRVSGVGAGSHGDAGRRGPAAGAGLVVDVGRHPLVRLEQDVHAGAAAGHGRLRLGD
ncbi:unnamed protein product [Phytophthora fragariaefolia]|uniref:Unnamed protein product n=1 Tax=Phytophthora fragariaefolia TaxID=1490495 RepID=A0A9W6YGF3_9STRA|nr:unnamed protein product [Phytophthora fragariaefolia]